MAPHPYANTGETHVHDVDPWKEEGNPTPGRILLVFLDGVGIGPPDPTKNPFLRAELPAIRRLLGGAVPTLSNPEITLYPPTRRGRVDAGPNGGNPGAAAEGGSSLEVAAFPLDPLLGVPGIPQSGTGQTALFTGMNAPEIYGRHFGPWVPVRLRPLLKDGNVLARAQAKGIPCAFANAYPQGFEAMPWARRPAAPPLMALSAGLLVRHEEALSRGNALSSEIVNTPWRLHLGEDRIPEISAMDAGRILARIAGENRLTLFAHYGTDHAGHRDSMDASVKALERVDAFLGGLVPALPPGTLLVLVSDHGNIEEIGKNHTRNPSLALLAGRGASAWRMGLRAITDVPGLILRYLSSTT